MADKPREIAFFKAVAFFILSLLFLAPDDLSGAESFSYVNHPPAEAAPLFSTNSYNLVPVLLPDFFYVKSLPATLFPGEMCIRDSLLPIFQAECIILKLTSPGSRVK